MLLTIDIGNTNLTIGFFDAQARGPVAPLLGTGRLETRLWAGKGVYARLLRRWASGVDPKKPVSGAVMASVVPALDKRVSAAVRKAFGCRCLQVTPRLATGIKNKYRRPGEVGADRIVNAAAAFAWKKTAAVIVDFGTATTVDCVNGRGEYLGGMIAPGPRLAAEALAEKTAKLPLLKDYRRPRSAIGRTTQESLAAGLFYGYVGLTERMVRETVKALGGRPAVLATGGLAPLIAPEIGVIHSVVPDLTLQGLRLIWHLNQGKK